MKKLFCLLLAVLMVLSLVACGGDKKAESGKKIDATIATAKSMLSKVSELERQRMQNQIDLWENAKNYF